MKIRARRATDASQQSERSICRPIAAKLPEAVTKQERCLISLKPRGVNLALYLVTGARCQQSCSQARITSALQKRSQFQLGDSTCRDCQGRRRLYKLGMSHDDFKSRQYCLQGYAPLLSHPQASCHRNSYLPVIYTIIAQNEAMCTLRPSWVRGRPINASPCKQCTSVLYQAAGAHAKLLLGLFDRAICAFHNHSL